MIILGIETSCDDTGIAIVEAVPSPPRRGGVRIPQFKIISNIVSSQVELHKKYGGVYPSLAKREHQRNLVPVLEQALKGAKLLEKNSKSEARNPKQSNPTGNLEFRAIQQNSKFKILNSVLKRESELLKSLLSFLKKYQKPKFDPHTKFGVGVDLIAVTSGPGLEPCLWVGVNFAKALAYVWDLPIIPVNHIEAHILVNFVNENPNDKIPGREADSPEGCMSNQIQNPKSKKIFPAICLVVSGGHTQLILMKDFGKYQIIGETQDDAAGECFDKTARILGLGYPGGPAISVVAEKLPTTHYKLQTILPRPMIHQKNYDFSFSGLKTAVLYDYKKRSLKVRKSEKYIQEMAKEIQQAIIDVLIKKTIKAAKDFKVKSIILGGGVTANKELRNQFEEACLKWNFKHLVPSKNLCTDNAAMTAITGYFHKPKEIESIEAEANLRL